MKTKTEQDMIYNDGEYYMHAAADLVRVAHAGFVVALIATPWLATDPSVLRLHALVCLVLVLHWASNNDQCLLSTFEAHLRGMERRDTVTDMLIGSFYRGSWDSRSVWVGTLVLGAFSAAKSTST